MKRLGQQSARIGAALLYGSWLLALGGLLEDRAYEVFLRPAFGPLLAFAILVVGALLLVEVGWKRTSSGWGWAELARGLWLLVPLIYLPLAREGRLDGDAFGRRWTGLSGVEAPAGPPRVGAHVSEAGVPPEEVTLLDLLRRGALYEGRHVTVTGLLKRAPEITADFGPEACLLYRFALHCCVADAMPVVILLQGPMPADWPDETWVRVTGVFGLEKKSGAAIPRLRIERVERRGPSPNPYLY